MRTPSAQLTFSKRSIVLAVHLSCLATLFGQEPVIRKPISHFELKGYEARLRVGDLVELDSTPETQSFLRGANLGSIRVRGGGNGWVVAPDINGKLTLSASAALRPGQYEISVSIDSATETREAVLSVTLDAMRTVASAATAPPVVFLNGWQAGVLDTCPLSSASVTFGALPASLGSTTSYWFDNCAQCRNQSIESCGAALGQYLNLIRFDNGQPVPQIDLVAHSMGGLIVRAYLAGFQPDGTIHPPATTKVRKAVFIGTPHFGSFLAKNLGTPGTQGFEMFPASAFLWTLATWNQGTDDMRGVDAIAIIGNEGTWQDGLFGSVWRDASDGVVSVTSASINFARDSYRTRVLPYCHIDSNSSAGAFINCTGSSIAKAPETAHTVQSFLSNTDDWKNIGQTPSTLSGVMVGVQESKALYLPDLSQVTVGSTRLDSNGALYSGDLLSSGSTTVQFSSPSFGAWTFNRVLSPGTYTPFRLKLGPFISSVRPLLSSAPGVVVASGGQITISGYGFGQCSNCTVAALPAGNAQAVTLNISSWSDQSIVATLPAYSGLVTLGVQNSSGLDVVRIMTAPVAVPVLQVLPQSLTFSAAAAGQDPPTQVLTVANAGTGALTWSVSATTQAGGTWLNVSPKSGTAPSSVVVSVSLNGLSAGSYSGAVTINSNGGNPVVIPVSLTVTQPPHLVVGVPQSSFSYQVGAPPPAPQSVSVVSTGGTLAFAASVTGQSWLMVTPATASTPATLTVSVNPSGLAAGSYSGQVMLTASSGGGTATVNVGLTVMQATPQVNIATVSNGASFLAGIAPASWVTITGVNLSKATRTWRSDEIVNGRLPTLLDGVSVTFNGAPAFVYFVSPTQLNVLAPDGLPDSRPAQIVATSPLGSASGSTSVQSLSPAMFMVDGQTAAAVNRDGAIVGPTSTYGNSHPARPGDVIELYLTGLGPTSPMVPAGTVTGMPAALSNSVAINVGGKSANVLYAGLVSPGLYQVNFAVPDLAPGNHKLTAAVAGTPAQNTAILVVEQ